MTDRPFPTVAFVRLGNPAVSKSLLINHILGDYGGQDAFFYRNCPNGEALRRVAEGMVECLWSLPTGKTKNFQQATLLLNLRGDGSRHSTQLNVLTGMCSVLVVITSAEDVGSSIHLETFSQICQSGKKVVALLTSKPDKELQISLQTKGAKVIASTTQNVRKLAEKICSEVASDLESVSSCVTLEEHALLVEKEGINTDEHDSLCMAGKDLARKLLKQIEGEEYRKKELLPLQGAIWKEYSELLKKANRDVCPLQSPLSKLEKLYDLRRQQAEQYTSCGGLVKEFAMALDSCSNNSGVTPYFLEWLNLFLDSFAIRHLAELWGKCYEARRQLRSVPCNPRTSDLIRIEEDLKDMPLCLNHLFQRTGTNV